MKNLKNFSISNKKVLFRADLNIPIISGKISDNSRIASYKSKSSLDMIAFEAIFPYSLI